MSIEIDLSEFEHLSANLGRASAAMVAEERKVVFKALMNIKKDTKNRVSKHPTWSRLAGSIDFDVVGLRGEVGYKDQGQGELAGIAEFGSARHAPHPALLPAAKAELPLFEKATADVMAKVMGDAL